jgi:serine/threonine protein kinase
MSSKYPRGTIIGSYEVIAPLASGDEGGMSHLYLARPQLGHADVRVVIKVSHLAPIYTSALKGEERRIRRFDHPNILRMLPIPDQSGAADQSPHYVAKVDPADPDSPWYLLLEYLPGGSLRQVLAQCGRLNPAAAVEIALQVSRGLARMHDDSVMHLDIKPENILLHKPLSRLTAEQPQVVIADLGTAQLRHQPHPAPGYATRAYLASERAEGHPPDPRQDIFALGIVLYEMLAGRRPYGDNALEAEALDPTRYPTALNRAVSPELEAIVLRAIDRDPRRRYQDIGDLQKDLERLDIERPGRLKRPILAGSPAYALAAAVLIALLLLLGSRLIAAAPWSRAAATPTIAATAPPTPAMTPTIASPILIVTVAPVHLGQSTATPPAIDTPQPTSTPIPSATASP